MKQWKIKQSKKSAEAEKQQHNIDTDGDNVIDSLDANPNDSSIQTFEEQQQRDEQLTKAREDEWER